jgi:predicted acetyltransferase
MARIINLPEMLRHISGNVKTTIAIRLSDPVLAKNDGDFIWYLDEEGSYMERVEQTVSTRPEVSATIGEFTAFIFEYITLKQNAKFDNIYLAGPVWMNERY